jgi:hypothetical protein
VPSREIGDRNGKSTREVLRKRQPGRLGNRAKAFFESVEQHWCRFVAIKSYLLKRAAKWNSTANLKEAIVKTSDGL